MEEHLLVTRLEQGSHHHPHKHATLTGEARTHINARKKRYVTFLEKSFE